MKQVEWNDSFSVGNALMDAHHRIFFETIQEFSKYPDKNNHDAIAKRIEFLLEYAAMHLEAEERLMRQANFPELNEHKAIHDAFVRQLQSIQETYSKNPDSITADQILKIMQDWLVNHIQGSDKRYMPYVRKLQS